MFTLKRFGRKERPVVALVLGSTWPVRVVHVARVVGLLAAGLLTGALAVVWLLDVELGRSATCTWLNLAR